ncbi:hypothetical protein J2045_002129 [Peteryoungia aggregata LMG 23059]|uniref:HNH homing endonuclease n=1 Tax=Peteryoungia aggregata LMG 23059 TaxID=1368425 RepID=A0ABU0G8W1_9HYPH|nr:hypothetical protein [Peteryoungia aggregata]MDQ0421102.1 hypothetical protein [Peteryoungia aggregata LMG 23059]
MKIRNSGRCALTGDSGPYSKSHVIPKVFARRVTQQSFISEDARGFLRRDFDAFRDDNLLTARGEKITEAYDNEIARTLRQHSLTYTSRRNKRELEINALTYPVYSFASLSVDKIHLIKLFTLSLLWRAAASSMSEFSDVQLNEAEQEELRSAVETGDPKSPEFFPAVFSVFDSKSELPKIYPYRVTILEDNFYRFFLDGVVCYVSCSKSTKGNYGNWKVGADKKLHLLVIPSEESFHDRISRDGSNELFEKFGDPWLRQKRR